MRALATLLLVLPLSALAEDESALPRWSLGAGVLGPAIYSTCDVVVNGGVLCVPSRGPGAGASLERRLSRSNWLVMGASGAISESEQVLDTQKYRSKLRQLTIDVGLRHLLTDRGALVDVSVLALAEGGYADNTITTEGSPSSDQSLTSWIAGGDVELALDRELTAGLSLRVATPLAGVWWQKTDEKLSGLSGQGHSITASFYLAPRLELRLAF